MGDVRIFDRMSAEEDVVFVHNRGLFEDETTLYEMNEKVGQMDYKQAILLLLNLPS